MFPVVRKEKGSELGQPFFFGLAAVRALAKACPGLRRRSLNSSELKEAAGCLWFRAASAAGGLLQAQPRCGSAGGHTRWGHGREATHSYHCRSAAW